MKIAKLLLSGSVAAVFGVAVPAQAATIDFETDDLGNATVVGTAVGATSYDAFGASFSDAFFQQCGGGCPDPSNGTFVSSLFTNSPFTISFANSINFFSFENVSFSSGTASAFDSSNNLLGSVSFSDFPGLFSFNQAGISLIEFSTTSQFGVDNFTFDVNGAVPEPGTWMLMLVGFLGLGAALRSPKRKPRVSVSYA